MSGPATIGPFDPIGGLPALEALATRAADYVALETGGPPDAPTALRWARAHLRGPLPPGVDRAGALHLGLWDGPRLDGLASAIFAYPQPRDAFLGLLLLAPEARAKGHGARLLRAAEVEARTRGATRMLVAVLDANPRGRAFWDREGFAAERHFTDRRYGARIHDVWRLSKPL